MSGQMWFLIQDLYFVPMQVLAEHDEVEQMVIVYLPATYAAIKAFNRFVFIVFQSSHWVLFFRICESGGISSDKDSDAASEVFGLLNTHAKGKSLQVDRIKIDGCASDKDDTAMEDFEDDDRSSESFNKVETKMNGWIKEEHTEDDDDDGDDDYTPSTFKSELKSPKKERIKCKRCPRSFAYIAALNKHIQKHKEEDEEDSDAEDDEPTPVATPENRYHCEMGCAKEGYKLKMKGSLIRHYMNVHDKPHECCGENFTEYKLFRKHQSKAHHNFQCAECAETFFRKEQLERHQKWHHEVEPQKCPMCPAVIKDVEMHMKNCHTGDLMTCSACPYTSRRKADIDGHYRKVHTDLNKETCSVCGETFKGLKRHLERTKCGTGKKAEATIPCPEGCPKMFTLQDTVDKHIRQVHLKIKNKICPFCEYKTYSRFNLKLHVTKMHEGKKMEKQQCLYCDKTPFSLDYHMQTYHHDKI